MRKCRVVAKSAMMPAAVGPHTAPEYLSGTVPSWHNDSRICHIPRARRPGAPSIYWEMPPPPVGYPPCTESPVSFLR
jgi:hypothetical protein